LRSPHPFRPPDRKLGRDPDYRFSLANERTFLAWIRTSLALVAGGLAIVSLLPAEDVPVLRDVVAVLLILLGTTMAAASFGRWASNEEAMRTDQPIPPSRLPMVLSIGVLLVSALAAALLLFLR
jgi:putative membrane protein